MSDPDEGLDTLADLIQHCLDTWDDKEMIVVHESACSSDDDGSGCDCRSFSIPLPEALAIGAEATAYRIAIAQGESHDIALKDSRLTTD